MGDPVSSDEFYVGYLPSAPPALARFVGRRVIGLALFAVALVPLLVLAMRPFSKAVFEFGVTREFAGRIQCMPYATLVVERGGVPAPGAAGVSRYLLVAPGKFGASEEVVTRAGRRVRLSGTLVYRDDQTLIEVVPGSVRELDGAAGVERASDSAWSEDLGLHSFVGEIVDSKCFLGVMQPGSTKPHRACAVRCISGGIPPVLLVRDGTGRASYFLLASSAGEAVNERVLDKVAEPVLIEGRVLRYDDLLVLRADPDSYNRLE